MIIPTTVDQHTEMDFIGVALAVYHRVNERRVAWDTVTQIADAVRDSSAVVAMYTDAKGELNARVLWPSSVTLTKDANIVTRAFCTLRKEVRSFRLDRVVTCRPLTTPDDYEPPEPRQDFEDSPMGAAFR